MDAETKALVREMTAASDGERIVFPQVVARLMAAGVERYHADLIAGEKTYYMPDGAHEVVACDRLDRPPAAAFEPAGVKAAVSEIQAGRIGYRAFCARIAEAGCVGYHVSIAGRRAVYYGRDLDSHVEWFPRSAP